MRICKVPGCGKKHNSRGFCHSHYQQLRLGAMETELVPVGLSLRADANEGRPELVAPYRAIVEEHGLGELADLLMAAHFGDVLRDVA